MLDPIHDECGIAAVYRLDRVPGEGSPDSGDSETARQKNWHEGSVTRIIPDMLIDLQNRGQLAAGLTRYDEDAAQLIDTYKQVGSVSDVFHLTHPDPKKFTDIVDEYEGRAAIGHTRYATCGKEDREYAQPFERHHGRKWKWFAFCFNGNVANYAEVRENLLEKDKGDYHLAHETDTELLMHHLSYALKGDEKPSFVEIYSHIAETVDGAYSLAFLNADGDLVLARDPQGFRPLVWGRRGNLVGAASESLALVNQGFKEIQDVPPGHLLHVTKSGVKLEQFAPSPRNSHCFFEWVYFANVASNINQRSVYLARTKLGETLADSESLEVSAEDCVAVPVPDTAKGACDAMAHRLGIPTREGLIRNRYVGRTFIEGKNRKERAKRKYTVLPEVLKGKRVFLVEDSIVRSTTLRVIIDMIREHGFAKEVHVRVACPPIMAPCSYGIDMSRISELIAPKFFDKPFRGDLPEEGLDALAEELGADSLRYLTVDQLTYSLELSENDLCLGCLIGKYPTDWGNRIYEEAKLAKDDDPEGDRTYERLARKRRGVASPANRLAGTDALSSNGGAATSSGGAGTNGNGSGGGASTTSTLPSPEITPVELD